MNRKRTGVDLLLLLIVLSLGIWGWRENLRRRAARQILPPPEAQPTPRVQDFMRRAGHSNDHPEIFPTPLPNPLPETNDPLPEIPPPAILGLVVTTPDGQPHPGPIEILTPEPGFHQWIADHRLALQLDPGVTRFFARYTDDFGTRVSETLEIETTPGESLTVEFVIPFPELASPGFQLLSREGYAEVVEVFPQSPAANAGMVQGDAVLAIDQISVEALNTETLNSLLLGPPGQPVHLLLIIRNDHGELEEIDVQLQRLR